MAATLLHLLYHLSLSFFCFFHFVYLLFFQHHVANELSLSQQPYSAALFNLPSSETEKCINSILIRKLAGNMQLTLIATRNETDSLQEREMERGQRVKGHLMQYPGDATTNWECSTLHFQRGAACLPPCDTRKSFGDTSKDYANCCGSSSPPAPTSFPCCWFGGIGLKLWLCAGRLRGEFDAGPFCCDKCRYNYLYRKHILWCRNFKMQLDAQLYEAATKREWYFRVTGLDILCKSAS